MIDWLLTGWLIVAQASQTNAQTPQPVTGQTRPDPSDPADADPLAPYRETVTVEGQSTPPIDAGVPAQFVVTASDLEPMRGALLDDPLRALQAMPGVATTDELRADLSVRGSPFRHTGLVVDDVKSRLLMHTVRGVEQTGSVALLNGDTVGGASLSAGSYPQRYGNSLGAELIIRTRDGRGDRVHGRVMSSLIATTATAEGPLGSDRVTWMIAARRSYASWIVSRIDPDISGTFDFQDAFSKVRARLGASQSVSLTWLGGTSVYDERGRRNAAFALDVGRNRTQLVSAHWQATPAASLLVSQRVSYVSARFRNTNPAERVLDEGHEREILARTSVMWTRPRLTVDTSAVVEGFSLDGEAVRFGGPFSGLVRPFDGRTRRLGGHLHVQGQPTARLHVSGGVRIDQMRGIGHAASPWGQVAFAATPRWRLQAAHGWHRQAPDLLQRSGPNANPTLRMERARHSDVGVGWQRGPWSAGVTAYHRHEADVLDTVGRWARPSATGGVFAGDPLAPWINGLDGTAQGLEFIVRRQAARWSGWVSYAAGRFEHTYGSDTPSFPSAFENAHLFNATVSARPRDRWDGTATLRLASNWPYDGFFEARDGRVFLSPARNALRLPTYARLDVRVRRVVPLGNTRLVIFGEAINLLNRRNIRQVEGSYDSRTLEVFRISERQLPIIPSIGLAFEF